RLQGLINGATTRLLVYNQELTDPAMVQLLISAKQRGVNVQVLLAGPSKGSDKNQPAMQQLEAAGVSVKQMTKKLYLHAKAMVVDNQAFVGSQNFSNDALTKNRELGEVVDDPTAVSQLAKLFQSDWARS